MAMWFPHSNSRSGYLQYVCTNSSQCPGSGATGAGNYLLTPAQLQSMDPSGIGANPAVETLFTSYPMPNNPTVGDGLNTEGYSFSYDADRSYNTYISRLDWDIRGNGKHVVFWRGVPFRNDDKEPGGPQFPGGSRQKIHRSPTARDLHAGYTELISSRHGTMHRCSASVR